MTVLLAPYGSRGDVQPLIAFGKALIARGHRVRFVAPAEAVHTVTSHGLPCGSNGVDLQAALHDAGGDLGVVWQWMLRNRIVPKLVDAVAAAADRADVVVSAGFPFAAPSVAAALDIPHVYCGWSPAHLAFGHSARARAGSAVLATALNSGRTHLGLPAIDDPMRHVLGPLTFLAADPELAPLPADAPAGVVQTGAWSLPDRAPIEPALAAFLARGAPPVYVGFGSMVPRRSHAVAMEVLGAARLVRCRLVLSGGWAHLADRQSASEHIAVIGSVAHDTLFPRVAAAIHHGGSGTTTTAARAGIPQVLVPHTLDQHYFARRTEALGISPASVAVEQMTADALAVRLRAALFDTAMQQRARDLGARVAARDGAAAAVEHLERVYGSTPSPPGAAAALTATLQARGRPD
ncbi:MAG: glycosyltransferase [Vicinamibacterales bacterium]